MNCTNILRTKQRRALLIPLMIGEFAQFYFYPMQNDLKLSIGIIVLSLILLLEEELSPFYISVTSGCCAVAFRTMLHAVMGQTTLTQSLWNNLPTLSFYFCFGILTQLFLKHFTASLFGRFAMFMVIDGISNLAESLTRQDITVAVVNMIVITAIIRSLTTNIAYQIYRNQKLFILNTEHQKRYIQLNMMISNIHAELFYLKKSVKDINNVMSKSYTMYEKFKNNPEIGKDALDIAREIHEIRKDYDRILKGFEALIDNIEKEDVLFLSDIFEIIKDNTNRILKENASQIQVEFFLDEDYEIKSYYDLFAVLNNLIVNGLDACEKNGSIKISTKSHEDDILFIIEDNGKGMEIDVVPYIFQPGFTTKFNEVTGKGSTGIGLYHVKNIVESLGGVIDVSSRPNIGTKFVVTIPKELL